MGAFENFEQSFYSFGHVMIQIFMTIGLIVFVSSLLILLYNLLFHPKKAEKIKKVSIYGLIYGFSMCALSASAILAIMISFDPFSDMRLQLSLPVFLSLGILGICLIICLPEAKTTRYMCIKSFFLNSKDEDGYITDSIIPKDSVWEESFEGGESDKRLICVNDSSGLDWIDVSNKTLAENFKKI